MGRPRSCDCERADCKTCRERARSARRWAALSPEQRRARAASRDRAKEARSAAARRKRPERLSVERARMAAYRAREPEKVRARKAVANAVRDGRLVRGGCERAGAGGCGGRVEAHHEDYARPLVVRWLCRIHHREADREMEAERAVDGGADPEASE